MIIIPRKIHEWVPLFTGACVLILAIAFFLQSQRADKWYDKYLVAEGDFQRKNEAYIDLRKEADRKKEILARERDEERQARGERNREINRIRADGRRKDAALVEAKAKIIELTPDELTTQLNQRVPDQYTLLGTENFSLTRSGGELTLSIFMDGERCTVALSERDSEIEEYKTKEISFNEEISNLNTDLKLTEDALDGPEGCNKARLAAINSKENLEKAFKAMKWKQFGKGVGGAAVIVVILKLTGII